MNARGVNLNFESMPDPRVVAWLEANGLDPQDVPAAQEALVHDGHGVPVLAVAVFTRNEDGVKIQGSFGFLKHIRVVPLQSAPEDHNL